MVYRRIIEKAYSNSSIFIPAACGEYCTFNFMLGCMEAFYTYKIYIVKYVSYVQNRIE